MLNISVDSGLRYKLLKCKSPTATVPCCRCTTPLKEFQKTNIELNKKNERNFEKFLENFEKSKDFNSITKLEEFLKNEGIKLEIKKEKKRKNQKLNFKILSPIKGFFKIKNEIIPINENIFNFFSIEVFHNIVLGLMRLVLSYLAKYCDSNTIPIINKNLESENLNEKVQISNIDSFYGVIYFF
jgi:hypothetical protein